MSTFKLAIIATLVVASASLADVSVSFSNSIASVGGAADTQPGTITLDFTVDSVGDVVLDASCSATDLGVKAAVDGWDGPVGSVGYTDMSFSIILNASVAKALRVSAWGGAGGGLGVTGENQWKIDDSGADSIVASVASLTYPVGLKITGIDWTSGNTGGETAVQLDATEGTFSHIITNATDSWSVSDNILTVDSLSFGNATTNGGYTLQGFSFDLVDASEVETVSITTFTENPGTTAGLITNIFTVFANGTETASTGNTGLPTDGSLYGATGSFDWSWEPVDLFDSTVVTGRVGTGWAYDGGQDAYGPKTITTTTIGMNAGDAIIMTISTNDLVLPAGKFLRLDNLQIRDDNGKSRVFFYDASEGTSTQITGSDPGQNPVAVGNYVYQALNQIVEDGDKIAFTTLGDSQVRQYGFQFSLAEVTDQTGVPQNLAATPVDSAILLDWDDDDSGYPLQEYTVYRSLSSGVTTNDFLANVTLSTIADTGLTNGITYYYAVSSTGTNGVESALSAVISAIPVADSGAIVMIQHLDATVGESVTLTNGNEMLVWGDQSGNGNNAVDGPGSPILWPSASLSGTGLSGMDVRTNRANITAFDSIETDAFLDFSGEAATNSGFSVLVAFKADYVTQDNTRNVVIGTQENMGGGVNGFGLRYDRGNMYAFANSSGILTTINKTALGGVKVIDGDTMVFAFTYKTASGLMSFWDSKNGTVATATAAPFGNFTTSDALYLAGSGNGGQYMDGMIGEVQVFSTTMSESELVSRGQTLATKWGAIAASGFDVWALDWGVNIGSTTNDYDNDGVLNLAEYALNGNPTNGFDDTETELISDAGLIYLHAQAHGDDELVYEVQTIDNLQYGTWTNAGYTSIIGTNVTGGAYDYVTNAVPTTDPVKFIRVKVDQN